MYYSHIDAHCSHDRACPRQAPGGACLCFCFLVFVTASSLVLFFLSSWFAYLQQRRLDELGLTMSLLGGECNSARRPAVAAGEVGQPGSSRRDAVCVGVGGRRVSVEVGEDVGARAG